MRCPCYQDMFYYGVGKQKVFAGLRIKTAIIYLITLRTIKYIIPYLLWLIGGKNAFI